MALLPTTFGGEEYAERFTNVTAAAFAGDSLNRAIVLELDDLPNDADITDERRFKQFFPIIKSSAAAGAILVEAGNFAAVAGWYVLSATS